MTTSVSDQAAVAAVPQRIVTAWADHDAAAFADVFTQDGTMILPGLFLKGREEIRTYMTKAFESAYKGTQVTGTPVEIRVLAPNVALLISAGGVLREGQTEVSDEAAIHASWLVVRDGDEWQLSAYQNSPTNG
jgi:uncharacterized protein (TIGR02246 family)